MAFWLTIVLVILTAAAGQIVFPENNVDPSIKNRDNRQPIYAPSKCPENELYYPGDQKNDWICDCRPAYLFHPATDRCHAAYRQGPCSERDYLVLPAGSVIPKCVHNPCSQDGFVPWKFNCSRLDATEVCPIVAGRPLRLGVNAASLTLECQPLVFASRFGEEPEEDGCPSGCRRSVAGLCPNHTTTVIS